MTEHQEQLILKFLNGTISPDEQKVLNAWATESEDNKKLMDDFALVWKVSREHYKQHDFATADEWKKFEANITKKAPVNAGTTVYWLRVAASISVIALFSWILYMVVFSNETILKESGEGIVQVELPDGSKVWLNRNSRLAYDDDFTSDKRTVKLLGEAFFEVRKREEKPFIILTSEAQIQVIGTSFNVQAYEGSDATEVFVATGSVNFASKVNRSAGVTLNAGDMGALLKNTSNVVLSPHENSNVLAWKEKKLIFNRSTIQSVVESIEHYFRIEIDVRNKDILKCRFTGSFNSPTLPEVIEALSISLDLTITKSDDSYVVDGQGC